MKEKPRHIVPADGRNQPTGTCPVTGHGPSHTQAGGDHPSGFPHGNGQTCPQLPEGHVRAADDPNTPGHPCEADGHPNSTTHGEGSGDSAKANGDPTPSSHNGETAGQPYPAHAESSGKATSLPDCSGHPGKATAHPNDTARAEPSGNPAKVIRDPASSGYNPKVPGHPDSTFHPDTSVNSPRFPGHAQGHPANIPIHPPAPFHPGPGTARPHANRPHGDPSLMRERFEGMATQNPGFFTVKRLESRSSPTDSPSPAIRTGIHCFVFVEHGETLVTIGSETSLLKGGECAVIPAGQVFSVRYWHRCTGYMGGFHPDFLTADCDGRSVMRTFPFLRKWGSHKVLLDGAQAPFVSNLLQRLLMETAGSGNRDILKTYLTALMVEIEQARAGGSDDEPHTDNKLCNDFVEYVFEHPTAEYSLADHASRLNVSPSHLTRTVKSLTGKTPLLWINEAVILEAKVLLSHTDLPVGEIARRVGHDDPSYFTRLFRKHVGMAPLAYRAGEAKNPKI